MNISYWRSLFPKDLSFSLERSPHQVAGDLLNRAAAEAPNRMAFSHEGKTLHYAELKKFSDSLSRYFRNSRGLKPGDRVLVQLPNILAFPVVTFAALKSGLIMVPCNPMYTEYEIGKIIDDCDPKLIITIRPNLNLFSSRKIPLLCSDIYDFHNNGKRWAATLYQRHKFGSRKQAISLRRAIALGQGFHEDSFKPKPTDIAVLQYTGGSTGVLKGAKISHENIVINVDQLLSFLKGKVRYQKETVLAILPMYHIFSFTIHSMMAVATQNHTVLIMNPLDLKNTLGEMKRWQFTVVSGLNTLFHTLMKHSDFKNVNFQYLHISISGGMALSKDIAKKWWQKTGCPILEGFGMSETSPVVSLNHPEHNELETVGYPLPQTEVRLTNKDGNLINTPNMVGELEVRGPQVCKGYWNNPEEDQKHFTKDGWFRSGDLAIFTHTGHLKIVGRKKNMIIVSGFNVYPSEVESVIRLHPQVLDCKVVGVPNKISGEIVKAIVKSKTETINAPELKSFCRKHLTAYKVPRIFEVSS